MGFGGAVAEGPTVAAVPVVDGEAEGVEVDVGGIGIEVLDEFLVFGGSGCSGEVAGFGIDGGFGDEVGMGELKDFVDVGVGEFRAEAEGQDGLAEAAFAVGFFLRFRIWDLGFGILDWGDSG